MRYYPIGNYLRKTQSPSIYKDQMKQVMLMGKRRIAYTSANGVKYRLWLLKERRQDDYVELQLIVESIKGDIYVVKPHFVTLHRSFVYGTINTLIANAVKRIQTIDL